MKNSIKALIIVLISSASINLMAQQTTGGIYLTEQDYKTHKLSYILAPNDKIRLNEFLNGKHISLTYEGKKIKLAKNEIFGCRLDNQDYRFFQNEAYGILDTAGFMLYRHGKLIQQVKGYKSVEGYFFSADTHQPILELTLENLAGSFPEQIGFRFSLQNYFGNDADLIAYDKASHQYKVKYLYFQQKQVLAAHRNSLNK